MKQLRGLCLVVAMMVLGLCGTVAVSAAPTDLSSMKIYAVDAAGKKIEVPINFSPTTYNYDITIKSDAVSIDIEYQTADATSKAEIVNEAYNTKMDTGADNKTQVRVTAANGSTVLYRINTTKLTPQEDEGFSYGTEEDETKADDDKKEEKKKDKDKSKDDVKVTVGKRTLRIAKKLPVDVPKGFEESKFEYKGKKYECIVKGDADKLVALYLYNSKVEGFYVYDQEDDEFYELKNINVASRMYTIVRSKEKADILSNYPRQKIEIGEEEVKAWVLDAEEEMYLVYAMNWDEETSLYSYDAKEGVFQRYLIDEDIYSQQEAAEVAYQKLQKNRTALANKYNMLLKVIGGLIIVIVMLIFVLINMKLDRKAKKLSKESHEASDDEYDEEEYLKKQKKKEEKKKAKEAKKNQKEIDQEETDLREVDSESTGEVEDFTETAEEVEEEMAESEEEEIENPEVPKRKLFGKHKVASVYGDMPTFGSEFESHEGFYGGEVVEEDEVLIDITDDEKDVEVIDHPEEPEQKTVEEVAETPEEILKNEEEDLKETLKSMLPPEEDDDDDDGFEFIDLD
ncbi:MAG: cadherin-like beta sandwich domain-containing protein [Eubacterium sp.]|nr:cadherin-like beta sandwich domain-containing protein [Eubacterium sp.]